MARRWRSAWHWHLPLDLQAGLHAARVRVGRPQAALLCGWELAKGMAAEAMSAKREREEPVESVRLSKRARKALQKHGQTQVSTVTKAERKGNCCAASLLHVLLLAAWRAAAARATSWGAAAPQGPAKSRFRHFVRTGYDLTNHRSLRLARACHFNQHGGFPTHLDLPRW